MINNNMFPQLKNNNVANFCKRLTRYAKKNVHNETVAKALIEYAVKTCPNGENKGNVLKAIEKGLNDNQNLTLETIKQLKSLFKYDVVREEKKGRGSGGGTSSEDTKSGDRGNLLNNNNYTGELVDDNSEEEEVSEKSKKDSNKKPLQLDIQRGWNEYVEGQKQLNEFLELEFEKILKMEGELKPQDKNYERTKNLFHQRAHLIREQLKNVHNPSQLLLENTKKVLLLEKKIHETLDISSQLERIKKESEEKIQRMKQQVMEQQVMEQIGKIQKFPDFFLKLNQKIQLINQNIKKLEKEGTEALKQVEEFNKISDNSTKLLKLEVHQENEKLALNNAELIKKAKENISEIKKKFGSVGYGLITAVKDLEALIKLLGHEQSHEYRIIKSNLEIIMKLAGIKEGHSVEINQLNNILNLFSEDIKNGLKEPLLLNYHNLISKDEKWSSEILEDQLCGVLANNDEMEIKIEEKKENLGDKEDIEEDNIIVLEDEDNIIIQKGEKGGKAEKGVLSEVEYKKRKAELELLEKLSKKKPSFDIAAKISNIKHEIDLYDALNEPWSKEGQAYWGKKINELEKLIKRENDPQELKRLRMLKGNVMLYKVLMKKEASIRNDAKEKRFEFNPLESRPLLFAQDFLKACTNEYELGRLLMPRDQNWELIENQIAYTDEPAESFNIWKDVVNKAAQIPPFWDDKELYSAVYLSQDCNANLLIEVDWLSLCSELDNTYIKNPKLTEDWQKADRKAAALKKFERAFDEGIKNRKEKIEKEENLKRKNELRVEMSNLKILKKYFYENLFASSGRNDFIFQDKIDLRTPLFNARSQDLINVVVASFDPQMQIKLMKDLYPEIGEMSSEDLMKEIEKIEKIEDTTFNKLYLATMKAVLAEKVCIGQLQILKGIADRPAIKDSVEAQLLYWNRVAQALGKAKADGGNIIDIWTKAGMSIIGNVPQSDKREVKLALNNALSLLTSGKGGESYEQYEKNFFKWRTLLAKVLYVAGGAILTVVSALYSGAGVYLPSTGMLSWGAYAVSAFVIPNILAIIGVAVAALTIAIAIKAAYHLGIRPYNKARDNYYNDAIIVRNVEEAEIGVKTLKIQRDRGYIDFNNYCQKVVMILNQLKMQGVDKKSINSVQFEGSLFRQSNLIKNLKGTDKLSYDLAMLYLDGASKEDIEQCISKAKNQWNTLKELKKIPGFVFLSLGALAIVSSSPLAIYMLALLFLTTGSAADYYDSKIEAIDKCDEGWRKFSEMALAEVEEVKEEANEHVEVEKLAPINIELEFTEESSDDDGDEGPSGDNNRNIQRQDRGLNEHVKVGLPGNVSNKKDVNDVKPINNKALTDFSKNKVLNADQLITVMSELLKRNDIKNNFAHKKISEWLKVLKLAKNEGIGNLDAIINIITELKSYFENDPGKLTFLDECLKLNNWRSHRFLSFKRIQKTDPGLDQSMDMVMALFCLDNLPYKVSKFCVDNNCSPFYALWKYNLLDEFIQKLDNLDSNDNSELNQLFIKLRNKVVDKEFLKREFSKTGDLVVNENDTENMFNHLKTQINVHAKNSFVLKNGIIKINLNDVVTDKIVVEKKKENISNDPKNQKIENNVKKPLDKNTLKLEREKELLKLQLLNPNSGEIEKRKLMIGFIEKKLGLVAEEKGKDSPAYNNLLIRLFAVTYLDEYKMAYELVIGDIEGRYVSQNTLIILQDIGKLGVLAKQLHDFNDETDPFYAEFIKLQNIFFYEDFTEIQKLFNYTENSSGFFPTHENTVKELYKSISLEKTFLYKKEFNTADEFAKYIADKYKWDKNQGLLLFYLIGKKLNSKEKHNMQTLFKIETEFRKGGPKNALAILYRCGFLSDCLEDLRKQNLNDLPKESIVRQWILAITGQDKINENTISQFLAGVEGIEEKEKILEIVGREKKNTRTGGSGGNKETTEVRKEEEVIENNTNTNTEIDNNFDEEKYNEWSLKVYRAILLQIRALNKIQMKSVDDSRRIFLLEKLLNDGIAGTRSSFLSYLEDDNWKGLNMLMALKGTDKNIFSMIMNNTDTLFTADVRLRFTMGMLYYYLNESAEENKKIIRSIMDYYKKFSDLMSIKKISFSTEDAKDIASCFDMIVDRPGKNQLTEVKNLFEKIANKYSQN